MLLVSSESVCSFAGQLSDVLVQDGGDHQAGDRLLGNVVLNHAEPKSEQDDLLLIIGHKKML